MKTILAAVIMVGISVNGHAQIAGPHRVSAPPHKFTWDNLLAASIKLQEHYNLEANVDSYMQRYQADTWNHVRNDEFELAAQRQRSLERFRRHVEEFSLDRNFVINTWMELGNYNFETESFPILRMGDGYHYSKYLYSKGSFPREFELYLTNHDLLASLPMAPQEARVFLQHRKDSKGNVNRRLDVKLYIRIVRLRRPTKDELMGEVQLARFYRNEKLNLVLRDITKPQPLATNEGVVSTAVSESSVKADEE